MARNSIVRCSRPQATTYSTAPQTLSQGNSSRRLPPLREQGGNGLMSAIADDRFGQISQCVAALHFAGLGNREETCRGHLPLGAAIAKNDLAQLHGNA